MDTAQAAAYLHLHPKTVGILARKGIIPGRQLAQKWRFSKAILDKWLEGD
jgi:excisionase family DNA binding protein